MTDILNRGHLVAAFYPVADAFAAGLTTDAVSVANYARAALLIDTGAIEDAGVSNIVTVEACTDAAGTGAVAMAFKSRVCLSSTTVDTWSELTARTAAGHNFALANAVANAKWYVEVDADEVAAALPGGKFVRVKVAETANKTITASGVWILSEARFPSAVPVTAIA